MTTAAQRLRLIMSHLALIALAAVVLLPFLSAIRMSFLPADDMFAPEFRLLPGRWVGLENYRRALSASPLLRYLLNGGLVCAAIIICQLLIAVPCAYALAKIRFAGERLVWISVALGIAVPPYALALPLFVMGAYTGLIDTYAALILPWIISPLGILLLRQAFVGVADEILQAARLDGLGELEIMLRIALPMITPAIGALVMISLIAHWNDLLWPSVAIQSSGKATPPFGVMLFQVQEIGSDYGPLLAGTVLIAAPLLLVFILVQRKFLDAFTAINPR